MVTSHRNCCLDAFREVSTGTVLLIKPYCFLKCLLPIWCGLKDLHRARPSNVQNPTFSSPILSFYFFKSLINCCHYRRIQSIVKSHGGKCPLLFLPMSELMALLPRLVLHFKDKVANNYFIEYPKFSRGEFTMVDLFHKWRPINNSCVFRKISLTSLVSKCKIQ